MFILSLFSPLISLIDLLYLWPAFSEMSGALCILSQVWKKTTGLSLVSILCPLTIFLSLAPGWQKHHHKYPGPNMTAWIAICYLFKTAGQSLDIELAILDQEQVLFLILKSANLTGARGRWPLKKILTENKSIRWFPNEPRLLIQLPLSNKKGKSVHYTLGQW